MNIGNQTENKTYYMNDENIRVPLPKVTNENDLDITIDNQLKFTIHINEQVKKANQVLGLIRRSFSFMNKKMFLQLYKSLVRPRLEYGSQAWAVIYKKESIAIETYRGERQR